MKAITHAELVARGLAFIAASQGDPRSSLNATYAHALAAEIARLRAQVAALQAVCDADMVRS